MPKDEMISNKDYEVATLLEVQASVSLDVTEDNGEPVEKSSVEVSQDVLRQALNDALDEFIHGSDERFDDFMDILSEKVSESTGFCVNGVSVSSVARTLKDLTEGPRSFGHDEEN